MERSFSVGAPGTGNKIKLYVTELRKDGSTRKTLLLNLDALGLPLDNIEGMAFGPRLAGASGRCSSSATTTSPRPSSRSSCCSR